jgi:hypothetical protein
VASVGVSEMVMAAAAIDSGALAVTMHRRESTDA